MMNKIVLSMCTIRLLSGTIEILAALWMLKLNHIEKAFLVNSGLAVVGPLVLLTTTALGIAGIADKMSIAKWGWLLLGMTCICVGVLKK